MLEKTAGCGASAEWPGLLPPNTRAQKLFRAEKLFAFPAIQQYWIQVMFDVIRAQLTTAGEKLAHLRRFL